MIDSRNLIWDTCIFSRYIIGDPIEFVSDIEEFVADARRGKRTIYFSAIVLAEIRQSAVKHDKEPELDKFLADLSAAFIPIDINPNIAMQAGRLRAAPTTNPAKDKNAKGRLLGTGDSIHLATALYLKAALGITDIVFHTTDEGKGSTWEGKCVPLLKFEDWYPPASRSKHIQAACDLSKSKPYYPQASLDLEAKDGSSIVPGRGH
jgi:predicted nucleic acid-binding protein